MVYRMACWIWFSHKCCIGIDYACLYLAQVYLKALHKKPGEEHINAFYQLIFEEEQNERTRQTRSGFILTHENILKNNCPLCEEVLALKTRDKTALHSSWNSIQSGSEVRKYYLVISLRSKEKNITTASDTWQVFLEEWWWRLYGVPVSFQMIIKLFIEIPCNTANKEPNYPVCMLHPLRYRSGAMVTQNGCFLEDR